MIPVRLRYARKFLVTWEESLCHPQDRLLKLAHRLSGREIAVLAHLNAALRERRNRQRRER